MKAFERIQARVLARHIRATRARRPQYQQARLPAAETMPAALRASTRDYHAGVALNNATVAAMELLDVLTLAAPFVDAHASEAERLAFSTATRIASERLLLELAAATRAITPLRGMN